MKKMIAVGFAVSMTLTALIVGANSGGDDLDKIRILRISNQDQRAVIKDPNGKMKVIKTGDILRTANGELRVTEIAPERIVLEQKAGNETEKIIIRTENGQQKTERLRKTGQPAGTPRLAPVHKNQMSR